MVTAFSKQMGCFDPSKALNKTRQICSQVGTFSKVRTETLSKGQAAAPAFIFEIILLISL